MNAYWETRSTFEMPSSRQTPDWQIDHWIKLTERDTAAPVTAKTPPHSLIVLVPERTLSVLEVEVKNPPADWVDTL